VLNRLYFHLHALILALNLTACGAMPSLPSSVTNGARLTEPDLTSVELLFWDNKNLGFGHVAVAIKAGGSSGDDIYVSYAMGNDFTVDMEKHGKDPQRLSLPPPKGETFSQFLAWYDESPYANPFDDNYGRDYGLLHHNCAHAALNVLRHLGYKIPISADRPLALRPIQVFRAASSVAG